MTPGRVLAALMAAFLAFDAAPALGCTYVGMSLWRVIERAEWIVLARMERIGRSAAHGDGCRRRSGK